MLAISSNKFFLINYPDLSIYSLLNYNNNKNSS
jgi:hypothetical protein